ncbi:coatomer subunit epsilon-1 [Olea europaea subsp. europaea]|uniref:Coatomer subunit epsilon-1 n=1 Tax=Olea europaea subsp. europaea TaxID=158383 RepID=A0A8S0RCN2_OLEEU|nr:coatomer subunit epsilon-1 [Olea europaea subsp. europaea]
MRLKQEDCEAEVDKLKRREAEISSLYATSLSKVQEMTISSLQERLGDPAIGNNPILRLIAGIIFMHEQDYNEALKRTNEGGTMDLSVFSRIDHENL